MQAMQVRFVVALFLAGGDHAQGGTVLPNTDELVVDRSLRSLAAFLLASNPFKPSTVSPRLLSLTTLDRIPLEQLEIGQEVEGRVRSTLRHPGIQPFSAFIDFGAQTNGLLHVSEITDEFAKEPSQLLRLDQAVKCRILNMDLDREEIALTCKDIQQKHPTPKQIDFSSRDRLSLEQLEIGQEVEGKVKGTLGHQGSRPFGAFIDFGAQTKGLLHVSQISDEFAEEPSQLLRLGQTIKCRILEIDMDEEQIALTCQEKQ